MIITCEQCLARFRLADDKIKPGGTRVRCSKCQNIFTVLPAPATGPEEPADLGETGPPPAVDEQSPPPPAPPESPRPRMSEPPADDTRGPVEFDFGFAADSEAGEPAATGGIEPGEAYGEFIFTAPTPEERPDTAFAEGTDEEEDRLLFAADAEAGEPAATGGLEPGEAYGEFTFTAPTPEERPDTAFATASVPDEEPFFFGTAEAAETGNDRAGSEEPSPFDIDAVFGEEEELAWDQGGGTEAAAFDFDEPSFAPAGAEKGLTRGEEGGLGFGEISFGDQVTSPAPAAPPVPPVPLATAGPAPPAVTPPRPAPRPPRDQDAAPTPSALRKGPLNRLLVLLALLLLALCGAGIYFYFADAGQQLAERLMATLKGEDAAVEAVEQRIGLSIAGSSYVDNREAGTLLVIQGATTNNFSGVRSAITVKGVLLNADGRVLQQQTVFAGNYLDEERLREAPYVQIEEAMNNQFGDSLSNMNVKPGATIRFTIVFRNPPPELASITVEVVDSKPGGL